MENPYLKHGIVSRTYYKKSLIMASTFGSKSKSFMTMSIPSQDEPLTNWPVVKAIALPQDVPSTSDRRLIELKNQVQRLMKAHLTPTQPTQVKKVTTSCEICSGPHDTQYCMKDPKQAFVEYASSHTDEARGMCDSYDEKAKENKKEEKDSSKNIHMNPSTLPDPSIAFITEKVLKLNVFFESLGLVPQSSDTEVVCTKGDDGEVMFIELIRNVDDSINGESEEEGSTTTEGVGVEYFDIFPSRSKLAYHKKIKRMHVFGGNFTYIVDFMIVEDISSIIDPRLSQVVPRKPFVEISNMNLDPPEGVVRFTNGTDEVVYKIPHMIEQYNSLSDLEKKHTKSVYLRNKEDKRR
uniref:Retrotransposon Orf1 n=1 Tax=Tanacetum cinerariifolium TaxID=118510 RepID=A0A6L2LUG8_TANCI|nr:retrotransposon Orf1 [Tanacetum cinerariifolium]